MLIKILFLLFLIVYYFFYDDFFPDRRSRGRSCKIPKNGQTALDNSFYVKTNRSNNQIRVGVSKGEFVILCQSVKGTFHGYACEWKHLKEDVQKILIKKEVVNSKGKIL